MIKPEERMSKKDDDEDNGGYKGRNVQSNPTRNPGDFDFELMPDTRTECARCATQGIFPTNYCDNCARAILNHFDIPPESAFDAEFAEYLPADPLTAIGNRLLEYFEDDFDRLNTAKIIYLWKKKGGKRGDKDKLGACQKPGGLLRHYSNADFIVWIAADNCVGMTEWQITALVYHELKHAGYDVESGNFVTRRHDFEGFAREVMIFGDWKSDIGMMRRAFAQPSLFEDVPEAKAAA